MRKHETVAAIFDALIAGRNTAKAISDVTGMTPTHVIQKLRELEKDGYVRQVCWLRPVGRRGRQVGHGPRAAAFIIPDDHRVKRTIFLAPRPWLECFVGRAVKQLSGAGRWIT